MKRLVVVLMFISISMVPSAFAHLYHGEQIELKASLSRITYRETVNQEFFMRDRGNLYGIDGIWRFHPTSDWMLALEALFTGGHMSYISNGTGSRSGAPDYLFEIRAVLGHHFELEGHDVIPYFGFGYRRLEDDGSDRVTTTGAFGYNRVSNYYYSPLGVEVMAFEHGDWQVNIIAEYDAFWYGQQESDIVPNRPSLNDQNSGYGVRGAVKIFRHLEGARDIIIEPYIRYWNINPSELTCVRYFCGVEPKNNSTEYGVKIGVLLNIGE